MSFGFGIGDIILACNTIYDYAKKYKDAPKEFDEIAEKAKATAVVLDRIDLEVSKPDNIVTRAGGQAELQLEANLKSLKKDCAELKDLVKRYDKIHDEGYGRRMMWAFKEANGLTDLRRRIGYHEQTLQIWYMTIFCESLRRIEGTSEKTLEAINLVKQMTADQYDQIKRALARGDLRPLKEALKDSGICSKSRTRRSHRYDHRHRPRPLSHDHHRESSDDSDDSDDSRPTPVMKPSQSRPHSGAEYEAFYKMQETQQEPRRNAIVEDDDFNSTLKAMRDYIAADPVAQTDMESRLRSSIMAEARLSGDSTMRSRDHLRPNRGGDKEPEMIIRRRSTGGQKSPRRDYGNRDRNDVQFVIRKPDLRKPSPSKPTGGESSNFGFLRVPGDSSSSRPRRSSDTPRIVHVVNSYESVTDENDRDEYRRREMSRERSRPRPAEQEFYRVISEPNGVRRSPSQNSSRGSNSHSHSRTGSTHSYERRRSVSRRRVESGDDR